MSCSEKESTIYYVCRYVCTYVHAYAQTYVHCKDTYIRMYVTCA